MHSFHRAQLALQQLESLSSPPESILRLLELALCEQSSVDDIAALVRTDPALTVEVLRRLSPDALRRRTALNISAAVTALGVAGMRELALRSPVRGEIRILDADEGAVCSLSARKHSVACAAAASELADATDCADPDVAYSAGLLASVGMLAQWDLFSDELPQLRRQLAGVSPHKCLELEQQVLGVDHESLAIVLSQSWNLPVELQDVLLSTYRTPDQIKRLASNGSDLALMTIVRCAARIAHVAGFPRFALSRLEDPPDDVVEFLREVDVDAVIERARSAVGAAAELARPLARTTHQALESMRRTHEELRRRLLDTERQLRAEESVNTVLQYGLNRLGDGDPLPGVMFRAMESMGFHRLSCLELDDRTGKIEVVGSCAASGHTRVSEGLWLPFSGDLGALMSPAILTRDDASQERQAVLELIGVASVAFAPLRARVAGKRLALVADRGRAGRAPVSGEDRCLGIIAEQLTLLLQFEELTKEKERLATLDPLTGAATRRRLMDRLEFLITQSTRTKLPVSLLIMDLDHFKKFNDAMGHQIGDRLLQDLVKILHRSVRKGDLVARYGGEEFVVLLPCCPLNNALAVAEDLRNAVCDYGAEQRQNYNGLPVSVSIGAAQWNGAELPLALIARADAALYASKHAGRNRVTAAAA